MSVATPTAPRSINPARLALVAALLAALFAGALLLGRSGADVPAATGPVLQEEAPGGTLPVSSPPESAALPRLRRPAPEPTSAQAPPPTTGSSPPAAPATPITPTTPTQPAPSGGSNGGDGGSIIIG